jgi:1-acyl-sn-glycerol-3-phosphate acyltransferase
MPVMIFPEGTRSLTDELGPFKDGAFHLAIRPAPTSSPWPSTAPPAPSPSTTGASAGPAPASSSATRSPPPACPLEDVPHLQADLVRAEIEALRARLRADLDA